MRTSWIPITEPGPQVTEDLIRRFEREFGYELPADYRAFLLDTNGGHAPSSHCVFTIRRRGRRDESTLNSLFSMNASRSCNDLATTQQRYDPLAKLPDGLLEIGYDGMGGCIILPLNGPHRGEVWYLDTESDTEFRPPGSIDWFKRRDVWMIAGSFREFVDGLRPLDAPPISKAKTHEVPELALRVTADDVRRYEREYGYELPEDYREFLVEVNGCRPSRERSVFRLRDQHSHLSFLMSLSDLEAHENDLADMQRVHGRWRDDLPTEAIAIGYATVGLILLFVAGPHRGEIWYLYILGPEEDEDVLADWFHRSDVIRLAGSFREFVDSLGPEQDL